MMHSRSTFARPLCRVVAFVAAAAYGAAPASAQSLGELAKQEEARRKAIKSSGKVYTNDSVKTDPASRGSGATPAAGAAAPSAGGAAAPPSPSGVQPPSAAGDKEKQAPAVDPKQAEAGWRQRIQAERDALARAQTFAEALQSRINALSNDFSSRDDPAQRAVIATDRQKALAELDRVKLEIQQHTKAISGIQEEARKSGVPPGWVR
jgi:DNA repair exonuclease SbcCD ATPase subunit